MSYVLILMIFVVTEWRLHRLESRRGPEMSDETRCQNSWFGSHRFEPRYDLGPADLSGFESIKGMGSGSFMEKLRQQTYVRDVCVKCGVTIERKEKP